MKTRKCTFCKRILPLTKEEFGSVMTKGFGGFGYRCRECRKRRETTRNRRRYRYKGERIDYCLNYQKKYREENGEGVLARRMVSKAIKENKLEKKPCLECGKIKSQAHHPDYSKPLKVVWLCSHHHQKLHYKLRENKQSPPLIKQSNNLIFNNKGYVEYNRNTRKI